MSCCGSYCGGGCGCSCGNCCKPSSPCQAAFPETCEALDPASIPVRLIVEDEADCKRSLLAPETFSILQYDSENEVLKWNDGSKAAPIVLPELQEQDGGIAPKVVIQNGDFEFAALEPTSTQTEPEVLLGTDGTGWEATERSAMFGSGSGALVRDATGTNQAGWQTGTTGQVLMIDSSGDARFDDISGASTSASIGGSGIYIARSTQNVLFASAAWVVMADSAGNRRQARNVSLAIDRTVTGANGIDAGTIAAATLYWVYAIYNATTDTVAGLVSLSSSAPTLPTGYTYFRLIGAAVTQTGTPFWYDDFRQSGNLFTSGATGGSTSLIPQSGNPSISGTGTFSSTITTTLPMTLVGEVFVSARAVAATSGTTTAYFSYSAYNPSSAQSLGTNSTYGTVASTVGIAINQVGISPVGGDWSQIAYNIEVTAFGGVGSQVSLGIVSVRWNFI